MQRRRRIQPIGLPSASAPDDVERKASSGSSCRWIRASIALLAAAWLVVLAAIHSALDSLASHHPAAPAQRRLEFVHITKTGGSAIESAGFQRGILWGACHFLSLPDVGCTRPDLNYTAPNFQSFALTSPWHSPPELLSRYASSDPARFNQLYPYRGADLFAVVRNPYDRAVSEYYCPWQGFHIKYGKPRQTSNLRKDINDAVNLNWWVQDMIGRLQAAVDAFKAAGGIALQKAQRRGLNEDPEVLAQKHFVNQAEYIFDSDGSTIIHNVLHYENLSAEFDALMIKYNLNGLRLPSKESGGIYTNSYDGGKRSNKPKLTYRDLDVKSIRLINEYARRDFEKLGYVMVDDGALGDSYSLEARLQL